MALVTKVVNVEDVFHIPGGSGSWSGGGLATLLLADE